MRRERTTTNVRFQPEIIALDREIRMRRERTTTNVRFQPEIIALDREMVS
jgi:hypothetical protein